MKHAKISSKNKIIIASILCCSMLCSWLCNLVMNSKAAGTPIVSGATYFTDTYTGDGKSSVQYATVDLNDISVEPVLLAKSKPTTRATVSSMMDSSKDIIGINASFYTTANSTSNAVGIIVDNGIIRSYSPSFNSKNNKFATLCISNDGSASIEYFSPYIAATSSNGKAYKVNRYNFAYEGGTGISVYDRTFATKSYGNKFEDVYEIVVKQGIMSSLRKNKAPVTIPKKGFVMTASGSGAKKLERMYVKGGKVTLEAYTHAADYVKPTVNPTVSEDPNVDTTATAVTAATTVTPTATPSSTRTPVSTDNPIPTSTARVEASETTTPAPSSSLEIMAVNYYATSTPAQTPQVASTPDIKKTAAPEATPVTSTMPTASPTAAPSFTPVPFEGVTFGDYKLCITGGAQLVSNGEALTSFSHLPSGTGVNSRTPKTAVGIGEDGKSLILVTVDGRSSNDAGISMKNLATYMTTLGAHNAINFDGGGSTTFVAKLPGEDKPTVKNTPSDGKQRSVINGLGIRCAIVSDGVPTNGKISGQTKSLVSVPIKLTMKIWDASLNNCPYEKSEVTWNFSGVEGTLSEDGLFTASTTGIAEITATYKDFTFTKKIKVYDAPTSWGFNYSPKLLADSGEKYTVKFKAINDDKKSCTVYSKAVGWSLSGKIGKISKTGKLTVKKSGTGKVTATYNKLSHTLPVSVCTLKQKALENFTASKKLTYKKSALKITQKVNKKKKYIKTDSSNLKVTYKVKKKQKKSRTISLPLSGKIPNYTYELGANIYVPKLNKNENTTVTLYYKNKKNKQRKIVLADKIKKGWNVLIYDSTLSNKCKLDKIVITIKNLKKHSATLYFDSIYVKYKHYPAVK